MPRTHRPSPLAAEVIDQARLYQNAVDALDEAALAYLGVNRSDGRCLDLLDFHGPMTAGALAAETGLSTGAVTALIDRLERQGLVRRRPHETDRRRVVVEVTDLSNQLTEAIYGPLAVDGAPIVGRYSDEELTVIADFLARARELTVKHTARVREMKRTT